MKQAALAAIAAFSITGSAQAAQEFVVNGGFDQVVRYDDDTIARAPGSYEIGDLTGGVSHLDGGSNVFDWTTAGYNFVFRPEDANVNADSRPNFNLSGSSPITHFGSTDALAFWGPGNADSPGGPATGPANGFTASNGGGNFIAADSNLTLNDGQPNAQLLTLPISQTLVGLTPGKVYQLTFEWAAAHQYGFQSDDNSGVYAGWDVTIAGQNYSTGDYHLPDQGFSGWMTETYYFTANSTSETLSFLATGGPNGLPPFSLLDSVSVNDTPEPATWALMLVGFGLAGTALRRRGAAKPQLALAAA